MRFGGAWAVRMALVGGLAGAALLAGIRAIERGHLERLRDLRRREVLERFAGLAKDIMFVKDEVFLVNYLRQLRQSTEIRYAAVVDARGRVRMHSDILNGVDLLGRPWDGPRGPGGGGAISAPKAGAGHVEDWSLSILDGERRLGEVHVGFDALFHEAAIERDLAESQRTLVPDILACVALGVLVVLLWAFKMQRRLASLRVGVRRLAAGEVSLPIAERDGDELEVLSGAINALAASQRRSTAALDQARARSATEVQRLLREADANAVRMLCGGQLVPAQFRLLQLLRQCLGRAYRGCVDLGRGQPGLARAGENGAAARVAIVPARPAAAPATRT